MPFTHLYVWVEGPDDERFTKAVLHPLFEERFDFVTVIPYAGMTKLKVTKWIESIRAIEGARYVFTADKDNHPCVSRKKEELVQKVKSIQPDHIIVVVKEIESWYLAGLTAEAQGQLEIAHVGDTSQVDKEAFDRLRSAKFKSRVDWMVEILGHYSVEVAVERNASLRYFISRFLP